MKTANVLPFEGQHCETTTTGTLLRQLGIELSEPMLFGLGEGLGYIFWNAKSMDFPFIGGRVKPDLLTQNLCRNLNLELDVKETSSSQKAWDAVQNLIDEGNPVGLKLDCYHLDYFTNPIHFAGHYATIYGYDDTYAFLIDTKQQGGRVRTSLKSLARARAEKGPMASRNLYYVVKKTDRPFDLHFAIPAAVRNNANVYVNPPITNVGYKGIYKTGTEIIKWFKTSKDVSGDFSTTSMLMERAGTGGALFRNLYRDFLKEGYGLLGHEALGKGYKDFRIIAGLWTRVSELFAEAGDTKDIKPIYEASEILKDIADREKTAMEQLASI